MKAQKYKEQAEHYRVDLTLAQEKLNQKVQEWDSMVKRVEEADRARTKSTTDSARLRVENEDLRRQLEQLQAIIKVDAAGEASGSGGPSLHHLESMKIFDKYTEELGKIQEKLFTDNNIMSTNISSSRQQMQSSAHSRHGSEIGSKSF